MGTKKNHTISTANHGKQSNSQKSRMQKMREARKRRAEEKVGDTASNELVVTGPCHTSGSVENRNTVPATDREFVSCSAKKIRAVMAYEDNNECGIRPDQEVFGQPEWSMVDVGQLNGLLSDLTCPLCEEATVKLSYGEKNGLARSLNVGCSNANCDYNRSGFTSPRLFGSERNNVAFDVNQRMVLLCVEVGGGFATLQKMCTIFGMPNMTEKTSERLLKKVCTVQVQSFQIELQPKVLDIVRSRYRAEFQLERDSEAPPGDEWHLDDGVPWIDVSFDGTWHRRGHVSHHGVGIVIDVFTGYVIDYHVLSTYCHRCRLKENEELTEAEWEAWRESHGPECQRNHEASAKAMERDAALFLWNNSVERTGFRYRTMLSDGDSVAFTAVARAKPYGDNRLVTKLDCINHVGKRMGTALRKISREKKLGGRGSGTLTLQKCDTLQKYYQKAVRQNHRSIEEMRNAIWATWFHCASTDNQPHHRRCPRGPDTWCFWQRAQARGEVPGSHARNVGTQLKYEVAMELVPLYRRMSSDELLKRLVHGKTQNPNESCHSVLWSMLSKTRFFGKARVEAAVAAAAGKFNRGRAHLGETMNSLALDVNDFSLQIIGQQDQDRVQKAESASQPGAVRRRRRHRLQQRTDQAQQADAEGEVYGQGMLADDQ